MLRLPHPRSCFFLSRRSSRACSATTSFNSCAWLLDLIRRRSPRRIAGKAAFAGLKELLRLAVVHALRDALAPTNLYDRRFAAQTVKHDPDLLLGRILFTGRAADVPDDPLGRRLGGGADFCLIFAPWKATMSQKSSAPQLPNSVLQALKRDMQMLVTRRNIFSRGIRVIDASDLLL